MSSPGVVKSGGSIGDYLKALHLELTANHDGDVATYIPELAKADANWLGLAIATVDGMVYTAGDVDIPFTIQSVSKPFMYGLALETLGREATLRKVGVEPTGEAFNSTVLDEENNRPFNPMVNAGAIAVSALVAGDSYAFKREAMVQTLSKFAGRRLTIDEATYRSEADTGDRNRAIASLMHEKGMIEGRVDEILDLYFSQCSVLVTGVDLALMAATLANGGVNPRTQARAMPQEYVHDVLTVMNSCGMYNYAGQWSYEVGIPAKSGVSGSVAAVIPGQIGIAAFSPRLDKFGNSVRAILACRRIAEDFGLHVFRTAPSPLEAIRGELSGAEVRSKRGRGPEEREILDRAGAGVRVIEAQGALFFGSAERIVRRVESLKAKADYIIVDLRRVYSADAAACALMERTISHFADADRKLIFAGLTGRREVAALAKAVAAHPSCPSFLDRDAALEWCETQLIASRHVPWHNENLPALENVMLFEGLPQKAIHGLEKIAQKVDYQPGDIILKEGDKADRFLIVMRGSVSVRLDIGPQSERSVRLAAFGPASTVGEMALLAGSRRSASVFADEPTTCLSFRLDAFWSLANHIKGMRETVLANLARDLSTRLRAANREVRALEE